MKFNFVTFTASAVIAFASATAFAAPVQVNENLLGLGTHVVNDIEKLNGGYKEVVTINNDGTFGASAFATFGQYYDAANDVISPLSGLTSLGSTYTLFAVFRSTGFVNPDLTSLTGQTGSFKLYAASGAVTGTLGATGFTDATYSTGIGTNVFELASSTSLTFGTGEGIGSQATAFKFLFDPMSLTADGMKFFTEPNPFYMSVNVNGDIDDGLTTLLPGNYTNVKGDVSAVFSNTVPEPGSIALLGLGLAGLGLSQRRRKAAAK